MVRTDLILEPEHYAETPAYKLLEAAAYGYIAVDHRFLHALLDHPERSLPDLVRFAVEVHLDARIDLDLTLMDVFRYLRTPEALPFYIDLVRHDPLNVEDELIEAFVDLGSRSVEPLLALLGELEKGQGGDVPFLLASRRIRAGLVALATFAVTVAVGFIVLPTASHDFWFRNLASHAGFTLQNQSIDGIVLRLLPGGSAAHAIWLVSAFGVAVAGLTVAALASRRGYELTGIVVCAVTGLLISPISWTHHWVWAVVPGLALTVAGDRRRAADAPGPETPEPAAAPGQDRIRNWIARAAGTAVLLFLFVMWPDRQEVGRVEDLLPRGLLRLAPNGYGAEKTWHGWQLILGNYYVIAGAVAIAGVAVYLLVTGLISRARSAAVRP